MSIGPLMIDVQGTALSEVERDVLQHPLVGGVILFSRNYAEPAQVAALIDAMQAGRKTRLLIAVDHEGGAVQRFREGFTRLPACAELGKQFDHDQQTGLDLAHAHGWLMASELRAVGVDFSFAPVLDLGGISRVINDRAFHKQPDKIGRLAFAYRRGMNDAGMAAVGKHFPGHGSVEADSHHEIPVDERSFEQIESADLIPFQRMINNGLEAIMPAHVIYSNVDERPAGFSPFWLQTVLRGKLNFTGVIFSDDLSMAGASVGGDYLERTRAALDAGCDMALICNKPEGAIQVIDQLGDYLDPVAQTRLIRMHGRNTMEYAKLAELADHKARKKQLDALHPDRELDLGDDEFA